MEPDARQLLDDELRDATEHGVVLDHALACEAHVATPAHPVLGARPPCRLEKTCRLRRVVHPGAVGRGVVKLVTRRNRAVRRSAVAMQGVSNEGGPSHGERCGSPDAQIVEAQVAASPVEAQVHARRLGVLPDVEAGILYQPRDLGERWPVHAVHLTALERSEPLVFIEDRDPFDAREPLAARLEKACEGARIALPRLGDDSLG